MQNRKVVLWVLTVALFMETLDVTILSTAIPTVAIHLNVAPINVKIALTSYLLSLALFIPISGWLSDKFGIKNTLLAAILIFTISSMLCGFSITLSQLAIFRFLQGVGGALMLPVGRLLLLRTFDKSELLRVVNYITIPALLGPMLGPAAGGVITSCFSWRWIFFVNIPFGILGAFILYKYLASSTIAGVPKFDLLGFILIGGGLFGLFFCFESITMHCLPGWVVLLIMLASLCLLKSYVFYYKFVSNPVFDFSLLSIRTFKVTVLGSLCSRIGVGGIPFILPLCFQIGLGWSSLLSGLLLMPLAISMIIMKLCANEIIKLFGFKKILIVNTALLGVAISAFGVIGTRPFCCTIVALIFIYGLLISLHFSALHGLLFVDLHKSQLSRGTSIASTAQQLSMSLGVTACELLLKMFNGSKNLLYGNIIVFQNTFYTIGAITLLSSVIFMGLRSDDGHLVSGVSTPAELDS